MTYLDPTEPWPAHSRPEAQKALKEAAGAGWYFTKLSNHAFGRIKCSVTTGADSCSLIVYSTSGPVDGSATAKNIRQALRKCHHHREPEAGDEPDLADDELERNVTRLLQAAAGLRERARAEAAIEAAIEGDDVDELDLQVDAQTWADNEAQVAWAQMGRPVDPWPPAVRADELLIEAEHMISLITDAEIAGRLRSQLDRTQA